MFESQDLSLFLIRLGRWRVCPPHEVGKWRAAPEGINPLGFHALGMWNRWRMPSHRTLISRQMRQSLNHTEVRMWACLRRIFAEQFGREQLGVRRVRSDTPARPSAA